MWRWLALVLLLPVAGCARPEPAGHCRPSLGIYPAGGLNGPPVCAVGLKWKLPLNSR